VFGGKTLPRHDLDYSRRICYGHLFRYFPAGFPSRFYPHRAIAPELPLCPRDFSRTSYVRNARYAEGSKRRFAVPVLSIRSDFFSPSNTRNFRLVEFSWSTDSLALAKYESSFPPCPHVSVFARRLARRRLYRFRFFIRLGTIFSCLDIKITFIVVKGKYVCLISKNRCTNDIDVYYI